ncbi:unnamed protein product, partial [Iphiclides podalirius]
MLRCRELLFAIEEREHLIVVPAEAFYVVMNFAGLCRLEAFAVAAGQSAGRAATPADYAATAQSATKRRAERAPRAVASHSARVRTAPYSTCTRSRHTSGARLSRDRPPRAPTCP